METKASESSHHVTTGVKVYDKAMNCPVNDEQRRVLSVQDNRVKDAT